MSGRNFNVDIAVCRESFIAREEKKRIQLESRRQAALEAAVNAITAVLPGYPSVCRAYLFGSVLRPGGFRPDSDVDIAVEGVSADEYFSVWRDLEEAMPGWTVDLRDLAPGSRFASQVQARGHLVYEREDSGEYSPRLLSDEAYQCLDELSRFRYVFRSMYTASLDAERLRLVIRHAGWKLSTAST